MNIDSITDKILMLIDFIKNNNDNSTYMKCNIECRFMMINYFYDVEHGLFHGLNALILYSLIKKINTQIFASILLHDFLKCNNYEQKLHDSCLKEFFPNLSEETYIHSDPSTKYKDTAVITADRLDLSRYHDYLDWVDDRFTSTVDLYFDKSFIGEYRDLRKLFLKAYITKIPTTGIDKLFLTLTRTIEKILFDINSKINLPYFYNKEELYNDKEWFTYLSNIYNINSIKFPFDIRGFNCFYETDSLPQSVKKCNLIKMKFKKKTFLMEDCYGILKNKKKKDHIIAHPNGFPNNSVVEIHHEYGDEEGCGYWMFLAPGSGISYNIGRTIVFQTHIECHKYFGYWNGGHCWDSRYFNQMVMCGLKMGFDTIQFTNHPIGSSGIAVFELVDLRQPGKQLKSGRPNPDTNFLFKTSNNCLYTGHKTILG